MENHGNAEFPPPKFVENVQPGLQLYLSLPVINFVNPVDPKIPNDVKVSKKVKPIFEAYR